MDSGKYNARYKGNKYIYSQIGACVLARLGRALPHSFEHSSTAFSSPAPPQFLGREPLAMLPQRSAKCVS